MPPWTIFALLGAGAALLASRGWHRRSHQRAASAASGLAPVADLSHLPGSLQRTALWALTDGGFERRPVHGRLARSAHDLGVTAFDLETLRERRGEWAYLPVDRAFRIGGTVSVVVCEVDRAFAHVLFKCEGHGDQLVDDDLLERATHVAKLARDGLGLSRSYAAELPSTLSSKAIEVELPADWRGYGDAALARELMGSGFGPLLARAGRRDLVIELIETLIVLYPAARSVIGPDAFADLTTTALSIADGVLACTPQLSPRGVESRRG